MLLQLENLGTDIMVDSFQGVALGQFHSFVELKALDIIMDSHPGNDWPELEYGQLFGCQ